MAKVARGFDKAKLQPRERLYIACEDLDLSWYHHEVRQVIADWEAGVPLGDMASRLGRDPDEVAILLMDLARQGRIKPREGGVYGAKGA